MWHSVVILIVVNNTKLPNDKTWSLYSHQVGLPSQHKLVTQDTKDKHITPVRYFKYKTIKNDKALRETQTLRAGCSKAERKISPRRSPT